MYIYIYIYISHYITPNSVSTLTRHLENQSTFRSLRRTVFETFRKTLTSGSLHWRAAHCLYQTLTQVNTSCAPSEHESIDKLDILKSNQSSRTGGPTFQKAVTSGYLLRCPNICGCHSVRTCIYIYIYMYICISHHITQNLESTPKRHLEGQSTFRSLRWTVFEERRPRTGPETGRRPAKIRVRDYINWYITYILTNWSFIITNNEMMSILHTNSVSYYS